MRLGVYVAYVHVYSDMAFRRVDALATHVLISRMPFKVNRTIHRPAIEPDELPKFLQDLKRNEPNLSPRTIRAIWFSLYTFCRPGEIRKSRWEQFHSSTKQWIIPKERMKMKRDHIVPICKQAQHILFEQYQETGNLDTPYVFPGQHNILRPMSENTVCGALKRLGYQGRMTAHGFRALARTTIRERLKYDVDVIEVQLAHKPIGVLGAAYDRAKFLDERKQMMQDWGDYICEFKTTLK